MHGGRGQSVISRGCASPSQAQREALVTVSEEIAAGQPIRIAAQVLIDLENQAVHAIVERVAHRKSSAAGGSRRERHAPGITSQQVRDHGIDHATRASKSGDIASGGHSNAERRVAMLALPFVRGEEECFVLEYRPAQRAAKLVIVEGILGRPLGIEKVTGIKVLVAQEFEERSVKVISTRLGHNIHDRARIAPVLGFAAADDGNLGECVDRQDRGWRPEHAGFVDGRVVAVTVVHVGAIKQIVIGAAAIAIGAKESEGSRRISLAAGIAGGPGHHDEQLAEIASIDRQLFCLARFNHATLVVVGGLHQRNLGRNLHFFRHLAGRQL